jgi:hypothetical protein
MRARTGIPVGDLFTVMEAWQVGLAPRGTPCGHGKDLVWTSGGVVLQRHAPLRAVASRARNARAATHEPSRRRRRLPLAAGKATTQLHA